jgi:DNA-binding transcriptional LysR family regulator
MSVPLASLFSLDLMKAFVAVGRRLNVTQAAEDLCLTQSAVSRKVRAFEEQVGVALFTRRQRGMVFTEAGERLFRVADAAVQQMQNVASELAGGGPWPVTITSTPGVTGLWLLPRLHKFQQRHPRTDLRLAVSSAVTDLKAEGMDMALRYARAVAVGPNAIRLFDETLAPVAHPLVAQALARGKAAPLLEFDDSRSWLQWRTWLQGATGKRQLLHFNQYDKVIQAAVAGQGVAIGRIELVRDLLDSEQLTVVDMPCKPMASPYAVWLVLADDMPRDDVRQVAEWIQAEAALVRSPVSRSRRA